MCLCEGRVGVLLLSCGCELSQLSGASLLWVWLWRCGPLSVCAPWPAHGHALCRFERVRPSLSTRPEGLSCVLCFIF